MEKTRPVLNNEPKVLGMFNFITIKPDLYDVLFYPYYGSSVAVIARNLSRKQMEDLKDGLNAELVMTKNDIRGIENTEPEPDK